MRVLLKYLGKLNLIETDDISREGNITFIDIRESDNSLTCDSIPLEFYNERLLDGLVRGFINFSSYSFLLSYE